ncbi:MAG: hypothetical protein U1E36_00070 [Rickettsiales bacterium]
MFRVSYEVMYTVLLALSGLVLGAAQPSSDALISMRSPIPVKQALSGCYESNVASEGVPSIFKEPRCMDSVKMPPRPGPMNPAALCDISPDLCPPTAPPPPSCMCSPPRPGALLGGQHTDLPVSFDVGHTFEGRTEWNALNGGWTKNISLIAQYLNEGPSCRHFVLSYPGVVGVNEEPFSVLSNRLQSCAAGTFNNHYANYGHALKAAGINHGLILRIGWEWNIGTNPGMSPKDKKSGTWHNELVPAFRSCFHNIVTSIRSTCGDCGIKFDYNSNGTINDALMREGYPGDDVVDIISIEAYDNSGSKTDAVARWANRQAKLDMARNFAKERGKYTAFPEWGLINCNIRTIPCSANLQNPSFTPGDNPYYIQKMCEYAKDPDNKVYYSIYFGGSADSYPWHDLNNPLNAQSRAAFINYCGCNTP